MGALRRTVMLTCAITMASGMAVPAAPAAPAERGSQQRVFFDWGARLGDPKTTDDAGDVAVHQGSTYVVGTTRGHRRDVLVAKCDDHGKVVWQRSIRRPADDVAAGVSAGSFGAVVLIDSQAGDPAAEPGFTVRRYRPGGGVAWQRRSTDLGLPAHATGHDVQVVGTRVFVVGSVPGDGGDTAPLVVELGLGGGALTKHVVGAFGSGATWTSAAQAGTDVAVLGRTDAGAGGGAVVLARFQAGTLDQEWSATIDTAGTDRPGGVSFYAHRLYLTGSVGGDLTRPVAGSSDVVVAAFKDTGGLVWQRQFGTPGADGPPSVAATPDGPLVAATVARPGTRTDARTTDAAVYFYARNGDLRERRRLGGEAYDGAVAAAWNFHGLRVAGETRSRLYGPSTGTQDLFVTDYAVRIRRKCRVEGCGTTT